MAHKLLDGIPFYSFAATSLDGIVTVRVNVAEESLQYGTSTFDPNNVKVDFEIHQYPFVGTRTRLALDTLLQSQTQSQNAGSDAIQNQQLLFKGPSTATPFGSFSWVPTAGGNDTIMNVIASTPEITFGNQFQIYFTFLTDPSQIHSDITWDPALGLSYRIPQVPVFCFFLCGALGVFVIIVLVVIGVVLGCISLNILMKHKATYQKLV